jgi:alpha-tubulin suppressor-like RCC1 family protein
VSGTCERILIVMTACVVPLTSGCTETSEPLVPVAFQAVSAGGKHTCAISVENTTYCWGRGENGERGDASYDNLAVPRSVGGDSSFAQLSAGHRHTCALTLERVGHCFGWNFEGQLGNGTTIDQALPVRVMGPPLASISAGWFHTCALATNGDAYCWGSNEQGQLGDGTTTRRLEPTRVSGPRMVAISSGGYHTCGLTSDGTAYCWGLNHQGQLGTGNTVGATRPARLAGDVHFREIDAGHSHSCAITTTGAAYCWGSNDFGEVGVGFASPAGWPGVREPAAVQGDIAFRNIDAGLGYTCGVADTATAHCWGRGLEGQLGNGALASWLTPQPVSGVTGFISVSTGGETHACGVTDANAVYCWGRGDSGQLGHARAFASALPVRVVDVVR